MKMIPKPVYTCDSCGEEVFLREVGTIGTEDSEYHFCDWSCMDARINEKENK